LTKIYCHKDGDGYCAGAIVLRKYPDADVIPIDFTDEFPIADIDPDEDVYIVDFSLNNLETFQDLMDVTTNIVWIDHHKTSIEKYSNIDLSEITTVLDTNHSGCMLTWNHFHPNENPPRAVELIEDMDIWKWEFGEETRDFIAGFDAMDKHPGNIMWDYLLGMKGTYLEQQDYILALRHNGKAIRQYIENDNRVYADNYGFECEFEGYNCFAMNKAKCGSMGFDSVWGMYDVYIAYVFNGKKFAVSLYSDDRIDVSEIAKKYGGGGHRGAAGFECDYFLPFVSGEECDCGDEMKPVWYCIGCDNKKPMDAKIEGRYSIN